MSHLAHSDRRIAVALALASSPGSIAERWAYLVLRLCEAQRDVKTISQWARLAAVSRTSLTDTCRLLNIKPHDARDLARLLRAELNSAATGAPAHSFLNISDSRTLKAMWTRCGAIQGRVDNAMTFLERQQFVPLDNPGICALRLLLSVGDDS